MDVWRNVVYQILPSTLLSTRTVKGCIHRIINLSFSIPVLIAVAVVCGSTGYAIGSLMYNAQLRRNFKRMVSLKHMPRPIRSCLMYCTEVVLISIFLMEAHNIYLSFYSTEMTKYNLRINLIIISVQLSITFLTNIRPRIYYFRFMDISFLPLSAVGLLFGLFDNKQDTAAIMCMIAIINKIIAKLYIITHHDFSLRIIFDTDNHNERSVGVFGDEGAVGVGDEGGVGVGDEGAVGVGDEGAVGVGDESGFGRDGDNKGNDSGHKGTDSDDDYNEMRKNNFNEGLGGSRNDTGNSYEHYDSGDDTDYLPGDHEDEESEHRNGDEEVQDLLFEQFGEQQGSSGAQEKKYFEKGEKSPEKDEQQDKILFQTNQKEIPLVEDLQKGNGLPKANVQKIQIDFNVEHGSKSSIVVYEKNKHLKTEQKIENFCEDSSKNDICSEIVKGEDNESLKDDLKDICSLKLNDQTENRSVDVKTDKSKFEKCFQKEEISDVFAPEWEKSTADRELKNKILEDSTKEKS